MKSVLVLLAVLTAGFAGQAVVLAPDNQPASAPSSSPMTSLDAVTIPRLLSYQGKLTDTLGTPVPDDDYSVSFRLYALPTGGSPFWNETQTVSTTDGLFSALLGATTPIDTMPDAGAAYLAMAVEGGAELAPRLRLASAAYAFLSERAADADLLQGRDTTWFARAGHTHSYVDSARAAANAHALEGNNLAALDTRYVNEGQSGSVTSAMILDGTLARADVAATFQAPFADTADYARAAPATDSARVAGNAHLLQTKDTTYFARASHSHPFVDSSRIAVSSYDSRALQGKDTTALDGRFVNEAQANAVATGMITDTAVTMPKLARAGAATGEVIKWTGSAWAPGPDNTGGGSGVTNVYQDTGITCVPNPIATTGNVKLNLSYTDARYVNEEQAGSVTSAMVLDGTLARDDVGVGFKSPYSDTADYARAAPAADSARVAGNSHKLQGKDTIALDGRFVNEGQADAITGGMLVNGTIAAADLGQMGAASGQVLKWTGAAWAPRNDSIGFGAPDSAPGSFAVTTDLRVYGKGRIGPGNSNSGTGAFVAGQSNSAGGNYASVTGGTDNSAAGTYSHVGGGGENSAGGNYAFVGGGEVNYATGQLSAIAGGVDNQAIGVLSAVGGGGINYAGDASSDTGAVVAGGQRNFATGPFAAVGGGRSNTASGLNATVPGGYADTCAADYGLASGDRVRVGAAAARTFAFGENFTTTTPRAVVFNHSGGATRLGVGVANPAWNADVAGTGRFSGKLQAAAGYRADTAVADSQWVTKGYVDQLGVSGDNAWVRAGGDSVLYTIHRLGVAKGGAGNLLNGGNTNGHVNLGVACTTGAAGQNHAYVTVGGGYGNYAANTGVTIAGGYQSTASGSYATVGGGNNNLATNNQTTVAGGTQNTASGGNSTVGGGWQNVASGAASAVPGGYADTCAGQYGLAAGDRVRVDAAAARTFAFGENFTTTTPRAVVFNHSGGATRLGVGVANPAWNADVAGTGRFSGKLQAAAGYKADTSVADSQWVTKGYVDQLGGGGSVTSVAQATGVVCSPNPITTTGTVRLDTSYADARYVNEGQTSSVTGAMIADGQVGSVDIRDTTVNTADIKDQAVTTDKIANGTITISDMGLGSVGGDNIHQMGASVGQVLKWNAAGYWWPGTDSTGASDNAWVRVGSDSVLYTAHKLGIARGGANNALYGSIAYSHVNLGIACTTGVDGSNLSSITVGGGSGNLASGAYATVGGGYQGVAGGSYAALAGGYRSAATGSAAAVGGGYQDSAIGDYSTVSGGRLNNASGDYATAGGGYQNAAGNSYATIGGGLTNVASGQYATVAGGNGNAAGGTASTIAGGEANRASGSGSVVCGGWDNMAAGPTSVVAGQEDTASGYSSGVLSGWHNRAGDAVTDTGAVVAGGMGNQATAIYSTIGGGVQNTATGNYSTLGGGRFNLAGGVCATVAGGLSDTAEAQYSMVPGGSGNAARGTYSFAAGRRAKAGHSGAFVWADGTNADFASTANDQFLVRANGGVGINTNNPQAALDVAGKFRSQNLALGAYRDSTLLCTLDTYVDIPGMTLTGTSDGGMLLITYVDGSPVVNAGDVTTSLVYRLLLDGSSIASGVIASSYADAFAQSPVTLHRLMPVSAGSHTVKVQWARYGDGSAVSFGTRTLSVVEF